MFGLKANRLNTFKLNVRLKLATILGYVAITLRNDLKGIFTSCAALAADMPLTDLVGCSLFTYDKYEVGYF